MDVKSSERLRNFTAESCKVGQDTKHAHRSLLTFSVNISGARLNAKELRDLDIEEILESDAKSRSHALRFLC